MTVFDVVVVGAGAAGSAAACTLGRHRSVVLIDRVAEPGWRIGETLPGAAKRLLVAIGGWRRFSAAAHGSVPLKVSRWGSETAVELDAMRDPDGAGWRLDRARFERDLRADAVEQGAAFLPHGVRRIERRAGRWHVALTNGETISAARLIDASGSRSRLLRSFGQRQLVIDRLVCAYQRVRQRAGADPSTYTQAVRDGWWYTAALPGGDRVVAFHGDADDPALRRCFRDGPLAAALTVPGLADVVGDVGTVRGDKPMLCAAHSVARSAAGDGWLSAGDSAISLDPLSSQGLFNALATGIEAGEATLAIIAGDDQATRRYADRMGQIWHTYLGHHAGFYRMERRWPDAMFWARRHGALWAARADRSTAVDASPP